MFSSDSDEEIRVPRRKVSPQCEKSGELTEKTNISNHFAVPNDDSNETDEEDNFQTLFKKKRKTKFQTGKHIGRSTHSTDDENDHRLLDDIPERRCRKKKKRELDNIASIPNENEKQLSELFQNKDLFEEDCISEEEESINEIKELFCDSVKGSKRPKSRSCASGVSKKERKRLHSETQKIIRESSISLPTYEPKRKSFTDFLSKLNSQKQQSPPRSRGVEIQDPVTTVLPKLTTDPSFVANHSSSVLDKFRHRFKSQLKSTAHEDEGKDEIKLSNGSSWQELKATLKNSLGRHRAEEAMHMEQMKKFEENEGMVLDEEEEAEFTSSESDSDEIEQKMSNKSCQPFLTVDSLRGEDTLLHAENYSHQGSEIVNHHDEDHTADLLSKDEGGDLHAETTTEKNHDAGCMGGCCDLRGVENDCSVGDGGEDDCSVGDGGEHIYLVVDGGEDVHSVVDGGEDVHSVVDGGEDVHSVVDGGEDVHSVVYGGEDVHSVVDGGEDVHSVVDGGKDIHSVVDDGEDVHSVVDGGEDVHSVVDGGEDMHSVVDGGEDMHSVVDGGEDIHSVVDGSEDVHSVGDGGEDVHSVGDDEDGNMMCYHESTIEDCLSDAEGSDSENEFLCIQRIRKSQVFISDDESENVSTISTGKESPLPQTKLTFVGLGVPSTNADSGFATDNMAVSVSKSASLEPSPSKSMTTSTIMSQDLFIDDSVQSDSVVFRQPKSCVSLVGSLDEETQFLDTQGFLCVRERKPPTSIPSALSTLITSDSQEGNPMESLLGLCSGQFTGREPTNDTNGVAEEESPSTQAVRELLGVSQPKQSSSLVGMFGKEIEDIEEADVLGLCSGRFPSQAAIEMSEDEDMPILRKKASHNMLAKAKVTKEERLAQFADNEAELSGSDIDSDPEDDQSSGLDEYEEDGGVSDVPDSDTELKKQVNRIHMRNVIADDKLELSEMKERFLAEGDLYEDGMHLKNGFFRKRKFVHYDSEVSLDLFSEDRTLDSGGEDVEEDSDDAAEITRRKKRVERDQFLKFIRNRQGGLLEEDEDSQSVLNVLSSTADGNPSGNGLGVFQRHLSQTHCGSFLKRNRSQLKRLASATSKVPNAIDGQKGVVFKVVPSSNDVGTPLTTGSKTTQPVKKKPKLSFLPVQPMSEDSNSVFDILN